MAPKKKTPVTAIDSTQEVPVQVPTPAPVDTVSPVVEKLATEEKVDEKVAQDKFAFMLEKLQSFNNEIKELVSVVKFLQKEHAKLQKQTSKKVKKVTTGNRTLSGFAKPSLLSEELCDFLAVSRGTSLARTEVTRMINQYIKKNNLQDAADKRHILPDEKLKQILSMSDEDKLTYFNLQKYMKRHFTKTD